MFKVGVGVFALSLAACVNSEVTYTGTAKYPAKPPGCPVKIFPSTTPDYKWEDLASVEAACSGNVGRSACINELKSRVCELGGDTLYAFKDGKSGDASIVIATVARRTGSEIQATNKEGPKQGGDSPPKPSGDTAPPPATGCDPPCSPGYKCSDAGQCLAQCNPPCSEGMHCNQQRTCESAPASNDK